MKIINNAGNKARELAAQLDPEQIKAALGHCEAEAIHRIGQIQPHGAMLVLAADAEQTILQVSENLGCFFPLTPEQVLNKGLAELIGPEQAAEIARQKKRAFLPGDTACLLYSVLDSSAGQEILELQTMIHQSGDLTILELEPVRQARSSSQILNVFDSVRRGMTAFDQSSDLSAYCQEITGFVRSIIGFDRVMIYRFDADWEGEVIAESRGEDETSYLGNRFPAGDIPPQARALYTQNRLRLVSDVNAVPVALIPPINPHTGQSPDMSFAVLRAFSPVHIEYLRNMGVGASLSISILLDGHLWGLIACHHQQASRVAHPVHEILDFIGKMVSMKIAVLDAKGRVATGTRLGAAITEAVRAIYGSEDIRHALSANLERTLDLLDTTGAIIQVDGERHRLGCVPNDAQIDALVDWLATQPAAEHLASNYLSSLFPPAVAYADIASGLVASPVGHGQRNFCLWFRPEKLQTVNWAGRPEKQMATDANGQWRISPRQSFATWSEIWQQHSERWAPDVIDCAVIFAKTLIEAVGHRTLKQREEFFRLFGEQTLELISRHDLAGLIRYAAPTSEKILGLLPAQLLGKQFAELAETIGPEDAGDVRLAFAAAVNENSQVIFRYRHPDGRVLWLETVLKRVAGSAGQDEIIAVTRDVTDRQKSSLAVENFQQLNLDLLESTGEGVLVINRVGFITYANPAACDILGWLPDELLGCHAHNTVHHSQADGTPIAETDCPSSKVLADGNASFCRHDCYFRRDGSPIDIATATTAVIKEGEITGAVVVFMPTGDSEYLSPLLAPEQAGAIMTLDTAGQITSFSAALTQLTGYAAHEVVGQRASLLKSQVHSHAFFREIWRQLKAENQWRGMIWNRCKDGTIRPFWVSMNAVADGAGDIEQYVAIYGETAVRSSPEAQLLFLASHDSLTGLPNRSQLSRRLHQALSRASRLGSRVAVGFIDVDHFKEVNDTFGHAVGDQFLIEIARRLKDSCREEDTMARWGGDEFVFLMEDVADPQAPLHLAERMLQNLAKPLKLSGQALRGEASIGIALFPDQEQCAVSLIQLADSAMYQAKKMGGCRVVAALAQGMS